MVVAFRRGDTNWAAVTLERAGAVVLVDLSDPASPRAVALARSGEKSTRDEPEGLAHFRDPVNQADYLFVANEGSNTLGVLRIPR